VQRSDRVKTLAAAAAGAPLPLAYAPFDLFWLAPLAFAVLFYAWAGATPRQAFARGYAFGATSFLGGIYWVFISVHDFGEAHVLLAGGLTVGLVAVLALFVGGAGYVAARWFVTTDVAARLLVLPALWVLAEWCRGWFLSGFGWLGAGYSQTESWLLGLAPLFGVYGMSWAVLVTAGALLCLGQRHGRGAAVMTLLVLWIGARYAQSEAWTAPRGTVRSVALVQGSVPQLLKWDRAQFAATLALYRELTFASAGHALIVWPEAAIPALYTQVTDYLDEIRRWSEQHGSTVLLGVLTGDASHFQNAVVALTDPPSFYVKRHLVPFGEYFPVPSFVRAWMRLQSLPYVDAEPGAADQPPLNLAGERIAVTICYEDVFGAEQLGALPEASLLVNVSNDAWFGDSIAPHQHLQIARVRAAEAGRYLLRATNTGITAIVDPRGLIVARAPQFEPTVLTGVVQGFSGRTPYAAWGNYPVVLGALLLLLAQLPITKLIMRPGT
jgi:apolipoprotein N-acyltransferase